MQRPKTVRGYQESIQLSGAYLQDKRAGEEEEEGGNRRSQIGQVKGQHRGSPVGDSLAAGEDADTGYEDGEGVEAACGGARSRGAALTQSAGTCCSAEARTPVVPWRPYIRCSTGRCLRRCRRLSSGINPSPRQAPEAGESRNSKMGECKIRDKSSGRE